MFKSTVKCITACCASLTNLGAITLKTFFVCYTSDNFDESIYYLELFLNALIQMFNAFFFFKKIIRSYPVEYQHIPNVAFCVLQSTY